MFVMYRLLLGLVHLAWWCCEALGLLLVLFRKRFEALWTRSSDPVELSRVPPHLALILVDERLVSVADLANVIAWSFAAGISFLTFYDQDGKIKTCEKRLMQELAKRADASVLKNVVWDSTSCSNGCSEAGPKENGHSNGYKNGLSSHKLRVNLMGYEDGRPKLVRAAVELGLREKLSNVRREQRLSVNEADEVIRAVYQTQFGSMPDPALALWCGSTPCLAGFLPWHTSLTEFMHVPSHHGITASEFRDLLLRYSKCEQRFGK